MTRDKALCLRVKCKHHHKDICSATCDMNPCPDNSPSNCEKCRLRNNVPSRCFYVPEHAVCQGTAQ